MGYPEPEALRMRGHGVKGQVLRQAPWVLGPRAWVAGGGRPVGVPGGPVCPPQSLGVLEGILDGIKVNGTEAKQGGVWVRPRGEQCQVTRWKAKKKERPMFPENQHVSKRKALNGAVRRTGFSIFLGKGMDKVTSDVSPGLYLETENPSGRLG
ncbi:hypothetical protein J1605_011034 [Eschrichtius robustus]|uniref:Uncharacterized protein n=1 Tax=Eschrichtius robustus TaxID=9764 RepID=A0AB34GS90_ESCRO|nr:hypothetical protein J1605_011034 [Eschrichtius robustus]